MKTQYYTATSLDGFIATEDDSLDWLFPLGDIADTGYGDFIAQVGALAMGASTYTWMLRHAQTVAAETGSAWPYTQPVWVFTHRDLPPVPGARLQFVQGDVRPVHAAMRTAAAGRNLWIVGGGDLAGQFLDAGLLDELILQVGSVTLGRGKPLLPRRLASPWLQLTGVRAIGRGFAELRYRVPAATGEVDAPADDPDAALLAELTALEVELHHPGVRCSAERLEALLLPDFDEIGRSGRRYDRATVIRHLAAQAVQPRIESDGFTVRRLGPDHALLGYRSAHRTDAGTLELHAHRTSVWRRDGTAWRLLHHQGTPAATPW